jgi:hypothetical protein
VSKGPQELRGAAVHLALGHGGQLLVGSFFLVEILLKQGRAILPSELLRPGVQCAVAGDLVMLDRLRRGNQRSVEKPNPPAISRFPDITEEPLRLPRQSTRSPAFISER